MGSAARSLSCETVTSRPAGPPPIGRISAVGPQAFSSQARPGPLVDVDELDYAIFRQLSPDGLIRFWGSRRTVDPRTSAREVADRVGLSEAGVRARLKNLEQLGYLRGRESWPNPGLFGASLVTAELPIPGPEEAARLRRELALVEGVTFARDILDETDRKIVVYYVSDIPSATARRTSLLQRLSPGQRIRGPVPYWLPPCSRSLTPLDWRLVRGFRQRPEATLAELADHVGVSPKTGSQRLYRLLDDRACWSTLSSDSEEMPLAMVTLRLRPGADPAAIGREAVERTPGWMPVAPDGMGLPPEARNGVVAGLVPAGAPAAIERVLRGILGIEGVAGVRRTFALGSQSYPQWVDEQLARTAPPRGG